MLFTTNRPNEWFTLLQENWQHNIFLYMAVVFRVYTGTYCKCELYIWQKDENDALQEIDKYIYISTHV